MEKLNVLLVEDDPLARQTIEMFIEKSERYAFDGAITSALMTEAYLCKHKIDLILMDVCTAMNANGIDTAERVNHTLMRSLLPILIHHFHPSQPFLKRNLFSLKFFCQMFRRSRILTPIFSFLQLLAFLNIIIGRILLPDTPISVP